MLSLEITLYFIADRKIVRHENGVGILVNDSILQNKNIYSNQREIVPCSYKRKNLEYHTIKWYAPTEEKNNHVKSDFYESLERL